MATHMYVAVLVVFVVAVFQCLEDFQHVIYINPATGQDNPDCLLSDNPISPCGNLTWVFHQHHANSTRYVLSEGSHYLTERTPTFEALTSLAFTGMGSVITCTVSDSGLVFIDVKNVTFHNITFQNCSSVVNSTSGKYNMDDSSGFQFHVFLVALYFHKCRDVIMTSMTVTRSPNAIAVAMCNTIGSNLIQDSFFTFNGGSANHPGGGGFYVEFTFCIPGDDSCKNFNNSIANFNYDSSFLFRNVVFKRNTARNLLNTETYVIPNKEIQNAFGKGGGLALIFKGNASHNTFEIADCKFEENEAVWGGGLLIEYQDLSINNTVFIHNSTFSGNRGTMSSETVGGGVRVGNYVYDLLVYPLASRNRVHMEKCQLSGNHAVTGGGMSVLAARQIAAGVSQLFALTIRDTNFTENRAQVGAGLECTQLSLFSSGQLLPVVIEASRFLNNSIHDDYMAGNQDGIREVGVGAVYTNGIPVQFQNEVKFEGNVGSALAVVGTFANFSNSVATFIANKGYSGGAVTLLGSAFLLINSHSVMAFEHNTADAHGGAIANVFIGRENFKAVPNCFLHHTVPFRHPNNWGAVFRFKDNKAGMLGQSIYTTSLLPCALAGGSGSSQLGKILCWEGWQYVRNNSLVHDCHGEINTGSGEITFANDTLHSGGEDSSTQLPVLVAIPGRQFQIPLIIKDDLENVVNNDTVLMAKSLNTDVSRVDSRYATTSGGFVQVDGIDGSNITLHLQTTNERVWELEVSVQLQKCPPGFVSSDEGVESYCKCDADYMGKVHCSPIFLNAKIINGYWFGEIPVDEYKNSTLVASLCLSGFCKVDSDSGMVEISSSYEELGGICDNNREGILCGQCREGYGPSVNTEDFKCVVCNDTAIAVNVVKYVLSVYLPLFILFVLIVAFSVRLTSGPANAFIFYAQAVTGTFNLKTDKYIPRITKHTYLFQAYKVPYGVFNLDFIGKFIRPLCFGSELNTLDVLELNYLVALFPLLMILVMIILVKINDRLSGSVKCCKFIRRRLPFKRLRQWKAGDYLLHTFAAFLLLSYTKFSLTSSYLININPFYNSSGQQVGAPRPYYAGHLTADSWEYILRYLVPACVVLFLGAIPAVVLLGYPVVWFEKFLIKINILWCWYPADKVQIFLDTFQGCYKDNRRFFAGMYFVFRLGINVCYILTGSLLEQFVIQQVACTVFIFIIAFFWPYRDEKWYLNYIDLLIFTNLAIVNSLSLYFFVYSQTNSQMDHIPTWPFVLQYILVFLPLLYMIIYLIWYLIAPSRKAKLKHLVMTPVTNMRRRRRRQYMKTTLLGPSGGGDTQEASSNTDDSKEETARASTTELALSAEFEAGSDDELEAMLERAQTQNTYRSTEASRSLQTPYQEWVHNATMGSRRLRESINKSKDSSVSQLIRPSDPSTTGSRVVIKPDDPMSEPMDLSDPTPQNPVRNYGSITT